MKEVNGRDETMVKDGRDNDEEGRNCSQSQESCQSNSLENGNRRLHWSEKPNLVQIRATNSEVSIAFKIMTPSLPIQLGVYRLCYMYDSLI